MGLDHAAVRKLVADALAPNQVENLCFDHFSEVFDDFADGQGHGQRVRSLVAYCKKKRELDRLVAEVKNLNPAAYEEMKGELYLSDAPADSGCGPDWYRTDAPIETCFVGKQPFVDQSAVRRGFDQLLVKESTGVMVLSGRRHLLTRRKARHLARYLAGQFHLRYVKIDLAEFLPRVQIDRNDKDEQLQPSPGELLRVLLVKTRRHDLLTELRDMVEEYSQSPRQALGLSGWLLGHLEEEDQKWWLVLDNLDRVTLPTGTKDLIYLLATEAQDMGPIRVTLIGEDPEITAGLMPQPPTEEIVPTGAPEVVEFFESVARHVDFNPEPGAFKEAARLVMEGLEEEDSEERLLKLERRLAGMAERIFGQ